MDWYRLGRTLLFQLQGETAHELALDMLGATERVGLLRKLRKKSKQCPVTVAGIEFPNPVGLAAGLDKNGDYIDALSRLGFGFLEIGTVTPRPQSGNPKPRIFRIPERQAIINRMGFNNKGVDYLVEQVKKAKYNGVLGINIGKNFDTAVEDATSDYLICLEKVYQYATYITINISSPNTPGLRTLQYGDSLKSLLEPVKQRQLELSKEFGYKPLFVKIAPDMNEEEIETVAQCLIDCEMDGVIATNTTLSRDGVQGLEHGAETGGLSGAPVKDLANNALETLANHLKGQLPIIGVGGIVDGDDAADKIKLGAQLVQIYSGFIYQGPELIDDAIEEIQDLD